MLRRMVVGLPRSGTTWAANWLTYDNQICVHDPLWFEHYSRWDKMDGISCTGIWRWPEFVRERASMNIPVLILRRDITEIRQSLALFDKQDGGDWLEHDADKQLAAITGDLILHMPYDALFEPGAAAQIWRHLRMPSQFDKHRHRMLAGIKMEPAEVVPRDADRDLHRRIMAELQERELRARNVV